MELIEKKVIDYINEVDALTPAPGGGSVASLVGALGVSLAKMLAHFSTNKKKFKESSLKEQEKFILAFKELDYYKDMLIKGIDDDAISYNAVTAAYKKGDQDEIEKALKYSALVAYEMQEASLKTLYYSEKLIALGNKNLYSDLISAAILLAACNEMASLNVVANANCMLDEELKGEKLLGVHPCVNTATVLLAPQELESYIQKSGNKIKYIKV